MTFRGNGKLLLTGEYAVLDGALALALPTKLGQTLTVENGASNGLLSWYSFDHKNNIWFFGDIELPQLAILGNSDIGMGRTLHGVLKAARELNPEFLKVRTGVDVTTSLEFDRNWGLGSSSTLVYCVAKWADVDPYDLLERTFGGSGYDIACAEAKGPVLYRRVDKMPVAEDADFRPAFADNLYFVYLGTKQNSRTAIGHYRSTSYAKDLLVEKITGLTQRALNASALEDFEEIISQHEMLLSEVLHLETVKEKHFKDFWGEMKSLGAWGGDFALATSERSPDETKSYFSAKGYNTVLMYKDLIL